MPSVPSAFRDAPPLELAIPPARLLTSHEELKLLRAAFDRNPGSVELQLALANLLTVQDFHDEAIALLDKWQIDDFRAHSTHALALLSRETADADRAVQDFSMRAFHLATSDDQRAEALTHFAKACIRLGQTDHARAVLRQALELNRHDKDAYKRVVALDLRDEQPQRALDFAADSVNAGVLHSRVLASQSLALASLGMIEEAREAQGLEQFLVQREPAPPEGWETLETFNRELAAELEQHPDMRYSRYGTASSKTWRIDQPALTRSRVLPALQRLIHREVLAYAAALPAEGHPFLQARPAQARLRNWCVLTEGDGHETWHVHQNGWLSGTYYVQVPDHITQGTGRGGCIAFGLPEDIVGQENADRFGETLVRPRPGLMTIFPSHTFHRTYPHGGSGRRICYAFDIIPQGTPAPDRA